MSLQGNLSSVSFPDLLQLLTMGGKTGTLRLQKEDATKEIYLNEGQIIYAASDNVDDSFENVLIRRGSIQMEQLNKAKEVSKITGKQLPATLVFLNILHKEKVAELVHRYVEDIVFSLFSWESGIFTFEEGQLPDVDFVVHALNTMNILLEGTRRIDEWTRLQKSLPSDNAVLRVVGSAFSEDKSLHITPEEVQILSLIDGERNIEEIKEKSPLDLFGTAKALHNLMLSEIVKTIGLKETAKVSEDREDSVITEITNMYAQCYQVVLEMMALKVGKGATKKLKTILDKGKKQYEVVNFISLEDNNIDFSHFIEMSKREISDEIRLHAVSSGLSYVLKELINYASNTLGSKIRKQIIDKIVEVSEQYLTKNSEEFKKYGFISDFQRATGINIIN
ncbi:MAG: DUF4388 domain-containing protein [Candidatus Zixiibacteriota bacterium]